MEYTELACQIALAVISSWPPGITSGTRSSGESRQGI